MHTAVANAEMEAAWDGDEGEEWARDWQRYDRSAGPYHRHMLAAADIEPQERVLDVGCGNGESTRDAARAAVDGSAVGVDLSSRMIARARQLAREEGLGNVSFERADVQVHPFAPASFDVSISRFGAMFFGDRSAAFQNIGHAMRPGARLAVVSWRGLDHNEWIRSIRDALAGGRDLPVPPPGSPGPFGLADSEGVAEMLRSSGFVHIGLESIDEPFWLGEDGEDAFNFIRSTGIARGLLQDLDEGQKMDALERLRLTMAAHENAEGATFGSSVWLITARRAG